ncbi:MAG: nucleotidyltransferase family protein [Rhodospirillaceae bacterium]|jgi:MurNAc alpha-1-phosphate uridylyltransferase|nr:nucleotidyltransferase family protein [Rhodospirillaceae bacterium]MBT5459070.1 nucleotidyltransferase family protein [Rhodospirillaceae bacterium]
MTPAIRKAMVLAAGLGLRMRPLTATRPKPLISVAGQTLLDRALDHLADAGTEEAVVNLHYLGEMIETHLGNRSAPRTILSWETDQLLETGGGVTKALPHLGDDPFYVVNADITWADGGTPALRRLAASWREDAMDALLLLHPVATATGYDGVGDYTLEGDGAATLRRRRDDPAAPYVFTGVQLLHPRLFASAPAGPFSLTRLYDEAETAGRLFGIIHDGDWHHIGTPAGLKVAEQHLTKKG